MSGVANPATGSPKATMNAYRNALRNSERDVAALLQTANVPEDNDPRFILKHSTHRPWTQPPKVANLFHGVVSLRSLV